MWLAQSVRVAIGMYLGVWLLLFGGCATGTVGAGPPPRPPLECSGVGLFMALVAVGVACLTRAGRMVCT
mgnify:CR=1 FL=1